MQCGRRNDALKLWTLWKSIGRKGLGELVDHQFELANVARRYVTEHPDYSLYSYEDSISVCFNYKDYDPVDLCAKLYEKAEILVGFGTFKEDTFVRLVTVNADNASDDIVNFFKVIEKFVAQFGDEIKKRPSTIKSQAN